MKKLIFSLIFLYVAFSYGQITSDSTVVGIGKKGGQVYTFDGSPVFGNDDQIFTDFSLSGSVLSITIENGNTVNVDLSTIVGNVTISDFSLSGNNLTLELSNGSTDTVDLSTITSGVSTLNDISDVSTAGATSGQVLKFNGANWVPGTDNDSGGSASISNAEYDASWNGDTSNGASKNALYDKIESVIAGSGATASVESKSDWNGTADTWMVTVEPGAGHQLFANNVYLVEDVDYTISGSTITYTDPPLVNEVHTYFPNVVVAGGGSGSSSLYHQQTITFTDPNMAGGAVEQTIVPAQGANKVIIVESIIVNASGISGSTGNQNIAVRHGTQTTELISGSRIWLYGSGTNMLSRFRGTDWFPFNAVQGVNDSVLIRLTSANLDTLTGSIVVTINYRVFDTSTNTFD